MTTTTLLFGLDNTTLSVKRRDLDAVDATSRLTLKLTYKETRQLDLQFTNTKPPYKQGEGGKVYMKAFLFFFVFFLFTRELKPS